MNLINKLPKSINQQNQVTTNPIALKHNDNNESNPHFQVRWSRSLRHQIRPHPHPPTRRSPHQRQSLRPKPRRNPHAQRRMGGIHAHKRHRMRRPRRLLSRRRIPRRHQSRGADGRYGQDPLGELCRVHGCRGGECGGVGGRGAGVGVG